MGEERGIERVNSLHNATECAFLDIHDVPILTCSSGITPGKLFGVYLAGAESNLGSGNLQEGQPKLHKTRQLNPRSKSFDNPLTGVSREPHLPENTPKDPPNGNIRDSPDLKMAVSHQGMINLESSGSGTEGLLTADCTEDRCSMPVVNPMDRAAQTFPTSTALQAPSRPSNLSYSSRDAQEDLFVLPSQPISIVIKDPSDGSIQTPRRSKTSSKPP